MSAHLPVAMVGVGVVLYSIGPVLAQASGVSGPVFAFWRLWLGVGVLAAAVAVSWRTGRAARAGRVARPARGAWRWPAAGGVAFGAHQLVFFSAMKATSVADVALIGTLTPVVVSLAAVRVFGERPPIRFVAWGAVAMAGAAVIAVEGGRGPEGDPVGMALAGLNVLALGAFFVVGKVARGGWDTLPYLLGVLAVAAVVVSAGVGLLGEPVGAVEDTDLVLAAAVAAGPGFLGHFAMTWALRWVPANLPPVVRLAQPVLAGLLAWAALGEPITGAHVGGGAVTIAGVAGAVLSRGEPEPPPSERPPEHPPGG